MAIRICAACGRDCRRKSVGSKCGKRVICLICNAYNYAAFNLNKKLIFYPENNPYVFPSGTRPHHITHPDGYDK